MSMIVVSARIAVLVTLLAVASELFALDYFPAGTIYDSRIPTPQSHLGFPVGQRHVRHHELLAYMHKLAAASDRITCEPYALSYGQRSLVVLTITSPDNHARLDTICKQHVRLAQPTRSPSVVLDRLPVVVYLGYGVHGNEASGTNAAALVAYHLAAGQGEAIESLLQRVVILLDPCLNPDGYARFSQWVNDHRGRKPNADPAHREHIEPWPSGRSNYYWFDLNRDWLPLQHPESQGRISLYRRWLPNFVLDFHEMSTRATFFFQPGVPKRKHPLIPKRNVQLTRQMAPYHARTLDAHGSQYFTEETFDDFYMGKGSTYPDLHGAIGILFEQASSRGNVQDRDSGPLTFPFTIKNQFLVSLSSLQAATELRQELLEYKRDFYRDSLVLANDGQVQHYLVSAPDDPDRGHNFLEILLRHGIELYELAEDFEADGQRFLCGNSYLIPTAQPEFRYLTALFETRTEFEEPIFYDVSTWTLPLAFGLRCAALTEPHPQPVLGRRIRRLTRSPVAVKTDPHDVAYVIDWRSYRAPRVLYRLLDAGLRVKVAQRPFAIQVEGQRRDFGYGTLLVPVGIQDQGRSGRLARMMKSAARDEGVSIYAARTGLTTEGIDFGSSSFAILEKPTVLLVTGEGVSAYEAGEVWHLLDRRMRMPVTLVDAARLGTTKLDDYSILVLVSGSYSRVSSAAVKRLGPWIEGGGTLISVGTAGRWLKDQELVDAELFSPDEGPAPDDKTVSNPTPERRPYADARSDAARNLIRGVILNTVIDTTHPICFGYPDRELPVFRNNRLFLRPAAGPYSNPVVYTDDPLLSGYLSQENLDQLKGSASVVVDRKGRGRVILMADNPNFRAFWYGTNRLFLNGIFFGPLIRQ